MSFHLGKPILVMLCLACVGALLIGLRPEMKPADLSLWVFAESHQRAYVGDERAVGEPPASKYIRTTGNDLDVVLMNVRALDVRLLSVFNTRGVGLEVPDAVEIEISHIGKFFRPPTAQIGFFPLNDFLKESGWYDQIVNARFAPWSKHGIIYGVPHDLHPTALTWRRDLFDQAGVDLAACRTWNELADACRTFRDYWKAQGRPRWPIGLSRTSSDNLIIMLQQRGINLVDDEERIYLNRPEVAHTLRVYAEMVAGKEPIGIDFNPSPGMSYRDLANGDVCAMITPDWTVGYLKHHAPDLQGKLSMRPLPIFDDGDAPTASWGGTMIGIPRDCRDPKASWKLIEAFYFDHDAIAYARQIDQILPPIRKYWRDDVYQRPDPYFFDDQNVNQLYIELADQLPVRYVTPFTVVAQQLLSDVLNRTVAQVDASQTSGLDAQIQQWLDEAARDLEKRIAFGTFED